AYTGYPDETVQFEIAAGRTTEVDFNLVQPQADTIRITGVREGDARAIMSQRQSMDIKNSLSAESFGDISEGNPGEFIKFMPGVDTDSTGDGTVRSVNLRGLPPAYTSITLNGVSLAAADANTGAEASRTFSFEQMSLGSIDAIEISKTISADVDANAPAGTINIRTKRAFDRTGRRIFFQLSGTTHSNQWDGDKRTGPSDGGYRGRRFQPGGQIEYSDVFLDGRLGVVAGLSYSKMYVEQEQITASRNYVPTALSPQPLAITAIEAQMGAREIMRQSASLNFDYKASDELTLSMMGLYNQSGIWAETASLIFTTGARTRGVIGDPIFDITTNQLAATNTVSVQNNLTYKDGNGYTLIPSFEFERDNWVLDGNVSLSKSISVYDPGGQVDGANALSAVLSRGNFSAQRAPDDLYEQAWQIKQLNGPDWSDPASYTGATPLILRTNTGARAEHTYTGAMLNFTYDTEVFAVPVEFKTGLKVQKAGYEYTDRSDEARFAYAGPQTLAQLLSDVRSTNDYSFADSGINIATLSGDDIYMPSMYALRKKYLANPEHWRPTAATTVSEWYNVNVANNRDFSESTAAAYAMATADLTDRLKVRAGVRWERTETSATEIDPRSADDVRAAGFTVNASTGRATTIPGSEYQFLNRPETERKGEYDYFFPSASLKYTFNDNLDLQIGYSRTIRRPEVSTLSGVWSIDDVNQIVVAPNPGLEPELSDNISVRLAHYFEPVGLIAVNYYQNRVTGLFQTQDMTAEEFGNIDPTLAGYTFRTTTTVGGDAINIRGYELELNHSLDYLPAPFNGLSIRGSYMINDPDIPIVRSADQLATLGLAYRQGPVRMFLNSVWTDEKYRTTTPSWFDALWDVNFSASYEFSNSWEAFLSARNLINSSRNVIVPGSLATSGEVGDHSAIYIH
ncbi:MAG: TonB-dependent receptor, partial [Burkholderiales bacterium]